MAMLGVVLTVLAFFINQVTCSCPSGWTQKHGDCYLMAENKETWQNAKTECESFQFDAWLAEPKTKIKFRNLNDFIQNKKGTGDIYWVGANCMLDTNWFNWQTGTKPKYLHGPMTCGHSGSAPEDCLSLRHNIACGWHFDEDVCSKMNYFVCETSAWSGSAVDINKVDYASSKFLVSEH